MFTESDGTCATQPPPPENVTDLPASAATIVAIADRCRAGCDRDAGESAFEIVRVRAPVAVAGGLLIVKPDVQVITGAMIVWPPGNLY